MAFPINSMLKQLRDDRRTSKPLKSRSGAAVGKVSFNDHFTQQTQVTDRHAYRAELDHLRSLLDEAGEDLERNPTVGNFEVFRTLMGSLISRVLEGGFQVENVGPGWHPADRHQIIRKIDAEAEALLEMVLEEHKDRTQIHKRISTLKGLVIDMMS